MTDQSSIKLNTDTATIGGFWVGLAGFVCGVVGVAVSIYSLFSKDPNLFWIAISGWLAALLVALAMGVVSFRLVGLISSLNQSLGTAIKQLAEKESENSRLLDINAYISAKAISPARRRTSSPVSGTASVETSQG